MHPTHAEATPDFLPEQLAPLVSDDAIQHAARLLSVDQLHVDLARRLKGTFDGRLRNLVEEDAKDLAVFLFGSAVNLLRNMPGDSLPFPVRVRSQKHLVSFLGLLFDLGQHFGFSLDRHVVRFEVMVHIHAQFIGGQILHVADGGHDGIAATQILRNRARFGRRLHNDQRFRHLSS